MITRTELKVGDKVRVTRAFDVYEIGTVGEVQRVIMATALYPYRIKIGHVADLPVGHDEIEKVEVDEDGYTPGFVPGARINHNWAGKGTLVKFNGHVPAGMRCWEVQYDSGHRHGGSGIGRGDYEENMTLIEPKETPVAETKTTKPEVGDTVRVTEGAGYPTGTVGQLMRIDKTDRDLPYRVALDGRGYGEWVRDVEKIGDSASDIEKLKSEIWKLFEFAREEWDFCSDGRADVEARLAALGITAPSKRFRVTYEVLADTEPPVMNIEGTVSYKVEEI